MSDNTDEIFEQRLRDMLAKVGDTVIPPLTPERLTALRTLIPQASATMPSLSLAWKHVIRDAWDALNIVKVVGATLKVVTPPLVRDGKEEGAHVNIVSCPVQNGELKVQIVPIGNRKAKAVLSVAGECGTRNDLSVELSLGQRLLEARPLEQKAEVTLDGIGSFIVTLFAGEEIMGAMNLDIGEAKDARNE